MKSTKNTSSAQAREKGPVTLNRSGPLGLCG